MPPKKKRMTRAEFMRMKQRMEATSGKAKKKRGKGRGRGGGSGADKSLFQQTGEGRRTDNAQNFRPSIVVQPYINVSDIGNSYNKQYGRFQPFPTRGFKPPPPPPNPPPPQPVRSGVRLGGTRLSSNIFERMPYSTIGTQTNIFNTSSTGSNTLPTLNPILRPPSGSGPTRQMMNISRTRVGSASLSGELAVRNPNLFNLGGIPRSNAGGNRPLEVDVITGNSDGLLNPNVLDTQAQIQQSKEMGSSPDEEEKEGELEQESKEGEEVDKIIQTEGGGERQEPIGEFGLTRHAPLERGHTRVAIEEIRNAGLTPVPERPTIEEIRKDGLTPQSFIRQIEDDLGTPPYEPVSRPSTATTMAIDPSRQQVGQPITERQETFSDTPLPPFPRSPLTRRPTRPITGMDTRRRPPSIFTSGMMGRDLQDRPLVINPVPPATATARQMPTAVATNIRPVFEEVMPQGMLVSKTMEDKGVGDNPVEGRPVGRPPRAPITDRQDPGRVSRDIQLGTRREFLEGGSIPSADELPRQDIRRYNVVRMPQAEPAVRYTSVDATGNVVFSPRTEGAGMEFESE